MIIAKGNGKKQSRWKEDGMASFQRNSNIAEIIEYVRRHLFSIFLFWFIHFLFADFQTSLQSFIALFTRKNIYLLLWSFIRYAMLIMIILTSKTDFTGRRLHVSINQTGEVPWICCESFRCWSLSWSQAFARKRSHTQVVTTASTAAPPPSEYAWVLFD